MRNCPFKLKKNLMNIIDAALLGSLRREKRRFSDVNAGPSLGAKQPQQITLSVQLSLCMYNMYVQYTIYFVWALI